jgi:hypothetical protein
VAVLALVLVLNNHSISIEPYFCEFFTKLLERYRNLALYRIPQCVRLYRS